MESTDSLSEGLLAGTVIAVAVAAFARSRGWGIALPVLGVGILVGLLPFGPRAPENAGDLFLFILAPLVFGEALSSSYRDLRSSRRAILALAVGLVVIVSVAVGAVAALLVPGVPWAVALALGAILAPTDAVSVAAIAGRAGLPRRVINILEGESLVNDGTGLTLLRVALVTAAAGSVTATQVAGVLALSVVGGVGTGVVVGLIMIAVIRRGRDPLVANAILILAPFPAYFIAEGVQGSGILAVVTAALMAAHAMSSDSGFRGRPQSLAAWRQITFLLQAFAFFLVGIELPATLTRIRSDQWPTLLLLVGAVMLTLIITRFLFAGAMWLASSRSQHRLGGREWVLVAWAGARGPVSGLAAFTLPVFLEDGNALPDRNLLLATTLCVIVLTLLLSPTLKPLANILSLTPDDHASMRGPIRQSLALAALERLDELIDDALASEQPLPDEFIALIRERYQLEADASEPGTPEREIGRRDRQRVLTEIINAQHEQLIRIRDTRGIPDAVLRPIQHELDLQRSALQGEGEGPVQAS
jgi:CPA1 family monovalent cation:H+ antiporter